LVVFADKDYDDLHKIAHNALDDAFQITVSSDISAGLLLEAVRAYRQVVAR